jgi:hypothetical protein
LAVIVVGEPTVEPGAGDVTFTLTPLELELAVRKKVDEVPNAPDESQARTYTL